MTKLLVMYSNAPPTPGHLERLSQLDGVQSIVVATSDETAVAGCGDADVFLGHRYLRQTLPYAEQLQWVQSTAGGIDHLLSPALIQREPMLTRCPIFSDVIALHAFTLALALVRRIPDAVDAQSKGCWAQRFDMLPMPRTAMIIGMGCIGKELAVLLRRQGLRVIGVVRTPQRLDPWCEEVVTLNNWRAYLDQADLCFLAIPGTSENENFFDEAAIAALPRHGVLVNVGRASTLDTRALVKHLRAGHLGGAALDVLDPIPLRTDDPLWSTPRLMITPKVASFSSDRQQRLESFIEDQVGRYLTGEPLEHRVSYPLIQRRTCEMSRLRRRLDYWHGCDPQTLTWTRDELRDLVAEHSAAVARTCP